MKINRHIFHMPPLISTSWKSIASLHVEKRPEPVLVISLFNSSKIEIPNLDPKIIQAIFTIHAQVLEQELAPATPKNAPQAEAPQPQPAPANLATAMDNTLSMTLPLPPHLVGMENMGTFMQHNPEQAEAPDLPKEMLEKISSLSKTMGIQESDTLPKPEPECNCYYCQIARAMHGDVVDQEIEAGAQITSEEEVISDDDLKFRTWDIEQTSEKLYLVTNPLDIKEHYSVFLGDPIGCTCGDKNCEHIKAVLSS